MIDTDDLPESKIIFDHLQEYHALEISLPNQRLHIGQVACKEYAVIVSPNTPDKPVDINLYDIYILAKIIPLSQWRFMDFRKQPRQWESVA